MFFLLLLLLALLITLFLLLLFSITPSHKRSITTIFCRRLFFFKIFVTRIGFKICYINKIVDASFNICNGRLIGSKPPFIIDDKLKSMFSTFQIVNVGKVVTRSMHRNLSTPSIEGSCNVNLSSTMFPTKDSWYSIIIQPTSFQLTIVVGVAICIHGHRSITSTSTTSSTPSSPHHMLLLCLSLRSSGRRLLLFCIICWCIMIT
mmetsp:Transcript_18145/g.26943  ORF Transcript_18145/g.26943 Transcript_18145/m.26943 type:complete len:204 (+) Transcript_18145:514-1125(+)